MTIGIDDLFETHMALDLPANFMFKVPNEKELKKFMNILLRRMLVCNNIKSISYQMEFIKDAISTHWDKPEQESWRTGPEFVKDE
jgi:hypothetical protein